MAGDASRTTIHELLEAARGRLRRLDPGEARDAVAAGAVLIDIHLGFRRATDLRVDSRHGGPPGAPSSPAHRLSM